MSIKNSGKDEIEESARKYGFPGGAVVGKECTCQCRRCGLIPGKIPWSRKWQPTPEFLPEKDRGAWRATVPGVAESDRIERLSRNKYVPAIMIGCHQGALQCLDCGAKLSDLTIENKLIFTF